MVPTRSDLASSAPDEAPGADRLAEPAARPSSPRRYRRVTCLTPWGEREEQDGELALRMATTRDGETAWGFGAHPSSSLAISVLLGLYQDGAPNPQRVLDVGCGAGVLSICCARMGAREVRGIDINPAAPRVAALNAADNGAGSCQFDTTPLAGIVGCYDLVIANLPSPEIQIELSGHLAARARGGLLITSGYISTHAAKIEQAYAALEMRFLYSAELTDTDGKEWSASLFKSRGLAGPSRPLP